MEHVAQSILIFRGQRVLLDSDLAEQAKRNIVRFLKSSCAGSRVRSLLCRLARTEVETLNRTQIATGSQKHRDPRYQPYAFTEHGAIMVATVLNSQRAVGMSKAACA